MTNLKYAALAASALACASVAAPATAGTTIQLNGINTITNANARLGYTIAAKYWESVLTNDATVVFNVGFAPLRTGVLAQAGSTRADVATSTVYSAMLSTGNSALDTAAMGTLTTQIAAGGGTGVNMVLSSLTNTSNKFFDTSHGVGTNNDTTYANTSVLKALGLLGGTNVDANITFGSTINFDFNPSNGVSAGQTDFIGVAIHEMGHGLGFVSGVDFYDVYGGPKGPGRGIFTDAEFQEIGGLNSTLDFFRYGSTGILDWSVGSNSYFSIDGGLTEFNGNSNFSSGAYNGDGYQASHWQAPRNNAGNFTCTKTDRVGVMNPYLCSGQTGDVTVEDIAAFDAMGWNVSIDALNSPNYYATSSDIYNRFLAVASVPEPSTWAMLIVGFGMIGGAMRRRTKAQLSFA